MNAPNEVPGVPDQLIKKSPSLTRTFGSTSVLQKLNVAFLLFRFWMRIIGVPSVDHSSALKALPLIMSMLSPTATQPQLSLVGNGTSSTSGSLRLTLRTLNASASFSCEVHDSPSALSVSFPRTASCRTSSRMARTAFGASANCSNFSNKISSVMRYAALLGLRTRRGIELV